jgi:hypothetical protein
VYYKYCSMAWWKLKDTVGVICCFAEGLYRICTCFYWNSNIFVSLEPMLNFGTLRQPLLGFYVRGQEEKKSRMIPKFSHTPMVFLTPGSVHASPSAWPPIDMSVFQIFIEYTDRKSQKNKIY